VNALQPGDTLLIPEDRNFYLTGGITSDGMSGVTWQIDGNITFNDERATWPLNSNGDVLECIYLTNVADVVFTSSNGKGVIDGNGNKWCI